MSRRPFSLSPAEGAVTVAAKNKIKSRKTP
jgi:hypothetical protein